MKARSEKYQEKRAQILQAATQTINLKGLKGLLISEVAARLRMAPTSVSYYFRTKEELAAACYLRSIETYTELIQAAAALPTVEQRLSYLVRTFFCRMQEVAEGRTDEITLFEDLRALGDREVFKPYVSMFVALRGLLLKDGELPRDTTRVNAQTHLVLTNFAYAHGWVQEYHPSTFSRAALRFEDILLRGIGSEKRGWNPQHLDIVSEAASVEAHPHEVFLRVATGLINLNGYRGASVENIVTELNVTRGAFYHHIDFKDDLIEACYARSVSVIRLAQEASGRLPVDSRGRLEAILASLVQRQLVGELQLLRNVFISVPEGMKRNIDVLNRPNETHLVSLISDGVADGSLRSVDILIAARILSCSLNACVELSIGNWLPSPLSDRATEHYLRPLFEGLLHCSAD